MTPRWRNLRELLALLDSWRPLYERGLSDVEITAHIHGRPLPGSILERVRAMRGAR